MKLCHGYRPTRRHTSADYYVPVDICYSAFALGLPVNLAASKTTAIAFYPNPRPCRSKVFQTTLVRV